MISSRGAAPVRVGPAQLLPFALGLASLLAYAFLPFAVQPGLGPTAIPELTAARANNELGIETNGLILLPLAGAVVLLLGGWSVVNPRLGRLAAAVTALMGVLTLEYYAVFALDYARTDAAYLASMGPGFWTLLALGALMVAQYALPRPAAGQLQPRALFANQEGAILLALVVLIVVIGLVNPRFLATRNMLDILQGNAYVAVAAIGMSMVIITGNIDISVGSLIGLLAVISGRLAVGEAGVLASWLAPLALGALVGAFNGFIVAYLRVPSIVVTLGMYSVLRGALIIWTSGQRVTGMPAEYHLAMLRPLGVPMPVLFMLVLTLGAALWLRYAPRGRELYAVGGNPEAARLSGISLSAVVMRAFVLNGVFAGVASVLYATQLRVIQATPPPGLELFVITAAVVGGVSILGGKGTVIGATLAAILLNAIRSGMIFVNVSPFWIQAVQGVLILVTVLIDLVRRRRQRL